MEKQDNPKLWGKAGANIEKISSAGLYIKREIEDAIIVDKPIVALSKIVTASGVDPEIQVYAQEHMLKFYSRLEEWDDKIQKLVVAGPEDFVTMREAEAGQKFLKALRLEARDLIQSWRDKKKQQMEADKLEDTLYLRMWQDIEPAMKEREAILEEKAKTHERWEEMQQREIAAERLLIVSPLAEKPEIYPLATMSASDFNNLVEFLTEKKRKADEAEVIRQAEIAALQRKTDEDNARLKLENDKLLAEKAEAMRLQAIENAAAEKLLAEARAKQAEAEAALKAQEKAAADAKARAEAEAEQQRLEDEAQAQEAAKAPVKQKFKGWLNQFTVPEHYKPEHELVKKIEDKFYLFLKWAESEVNKL